MAIFTTGADQLSFSSAQTMATWFSFLTLSGCDTSGQKLSPSQVTSGPLTINWRIERKASWAWYTNGGSPGGKSSTAVFGVRHAGKPVVVSTSDGPQAEFAQALFLTGAPRPTVLAGANALYLITDESGRLDVTPINEDGGGLG